MAQQAVNLMDEELLPDDLGTLGVAHATNGDFPIAIQTTLQAIEHCKDESHLEQLTRRL